MGDGSLVLDHWHTSFDPLRERISKRHLWVMLPHLPFPLWNKNVLEGIANSIGWFVAIETNFLLDFDKRVARVLVEMDVSLGLPADVEVLCGECLFIQKLDYLRVPFRCSICHETGHLWRHCHTLHTNNEDSGSDIL